MGRVQPGFAAVGGVGQGEHAGDVAVALPVLGQKDDAGAVRQGKLAAGDRLDPEAVGQPGEFQGAAQIGVGQGQGGIPVLSGLGQQLVDVGGAHTEGIEALDVEFHVCSGHGRPCALRGLPEPALLMLVPEQGRLPAVLSAHPVVGSGHGLGHPPKVEAP